MWWKEPLFLTRQGIILGERNLKRNINENLHGYVLLPKTIVKTQTSLILESFIRCGRLDLQKEHIHLLALVGCESLLAVPEDFEAGTARCCFQFVCWEQGVSCLSGEEHMGPHHHHFCCSHCYSRFCFRGIFIPWPNKPGLEPAHRSHHPIKPMCYG